MNADNSLAGLEETLLGGPRRYTRADLAERSGLDPELGRRLWRALGFTDVPDGEVAFTEADAEALRLLAGLLSGGLLDEHLAVAVTRFLGRTMYRLAQTEVDVVDAARAEGDDPDAMVTAEVAAMRELLPVAERLLVHVWRRHLAAIAARRLRQPDPLGEPEVDLAVGFADLEGYSSLTRTLAEEELMALVDGFEDLASQTVSAHGGRVVKIVGDEVLFVTSDVAAGAEVALALTEAGGTDGLPRVRAGLAAGRVLTWLGDVYGPVVNIAARLTGLARPGTVLVDKVAAEELRDHPEYRIRSLRPRRVRGYDHLAPALLTRASG